MADYRIALDAGHGGSDPGAVYKGRQEKDRHLTSPSMLCVLSVQDWLAIDEKLRLPDADAERINIPANPKHYWRYRMHLSLEELAASKEFMENITELIAQGGRN